jgi:hypothetical protein
MPTRVYKSTDSGAPALNGQSGSLIAVLRACLVDGYGSQQPLGWSMPYTDGNTPPLRAHFRQASKTDWDRYDLEVLDNSGNTANLWGWAGATELGSGEVSFPARSTSGVYFRKSSASDTTPKQWLLVGTDRSFIFVAYHNSSTDQNAAEVFFFGDTIPVGPADTWAVALLGRGVSSLRPGIASLFDGEVVRAMPYTFQGLQGPAYVERLWPAGVRSDDSVVGNGILDYPNGPDGRGYIDRALLVEAGNLRALLPGFWVPLHNWKQNTFISNWQTFDGAGDLAGRSFIVAKWGNGNAGTGTVAFCIETSDTWYEV